MTRATASKLVWEQRLARGQRGDVWRVSAADGQRMVAKQISAATPAQRTRLRALVRRGRVLGPPLLPFLDSVIAAGELWLLRAFDAGVPLTRLTALSSLRQHELAAIAAGCLQGLAQLQAAGLSHGGVRCSNVFIEADGALRLVDAGIQPALKPRDRAGAAGDIEAVARLICSIWPESRRAGGPELHELVAGGRLAGAESAAAALAMLAAAFPTVADVAAADPTLAAIATRLLPPAVEPPYALPAAPVGAAAGSAPSADTAAETIRADPRRLEQASAALAAALAADRRRRLRRFAAAAGTTLAVAAAVSAVVLLRPTPHAPGPTARVAPLPSPSHGAPPATPAPTAPPSPAGTAVLQPAAPASAGFISRTELLPLDSCQPAQPCSVKSVVDLVLPHASTAITWELVAVDRCMGAQSVLDTYSITPDPSWDTVWATPQITVASTDPTFLYTVTVDPWRVASPPVPVGAGSSCSSPT